MQLSKKNIVFNYFFMKKTSTNKYYFGLKFIATGDDTNGRYFMSETIIPAGDFGPPLHSHLNEDESFYLKKGQYYGSPKARNALNALKALLSDSELAALERKTM